MEPLPEELAPFQASLRDLLAKAKSSSKVDVLATAIYESSKGNRFGDVLVLTLSDDPRARRAVSRAVQRAMRADASAQELELGLQLVTGLALAKALDREPPRAPDVHPVADRRPAAPARVQDDCPGTCSIRPRWG